MPTSKALKLFLSPLEDWTTYLLPFLYVLLQLKPEWIVLLMQAGRLTWSWNLREHMLGFEMVFYDPAAPLKKKHIQNLSHSECKNVCVRTKQGMDGENIHIRSFLPRV